MKRPRKMSTFRILDIAIYLFTSIDNFQNFAFIIPVIGNTILLKMDRHGRSPLYRRNRQIILEATNLHKWYICKTYFNRIKSNEILVLTLESV